MECFCCGEDREVVVPLQCHDDVKVCPTCIEWLRSRVGTPDSTPILPVTDMDAAAEFYRTAGFDVERYQGDGDYAFVELRGTSVLDLDVVDRIDPATNGAGCYIIIPEVDELHTKLATIGLTVTEVEIQPWGMREFTLTDPYKNHLRFGHSI